MKFLLLLLVVAFALWLLKTKGRAVPPPTARKAPPKAPQPAAPMLACAHCGLHLPRADTVQDAVGRAYCSEAHRQDGPL